MSRRPFFRIDSPYPWLVYLGLYFLPWLSQPPDAGALWTTAWVLPLFLFLNLRGFHAEQPLVWFYIAALAMLGFAALPASSMSTVFVVYAAATSGYQRPKRRAFLAITVLAAVLAAFGWASGLPPGRWAIGTFIVAIVGGSCVLSADLVTMNYKLQASRTEAMQLASSAERERIGRDLHDVLGHTLTLISIKADLARRLIDMDVSKARDEIEEVQSIARKSLSEIREAVTGLRDASVAAEITHARRALEAAEIEIEVGARASTDDPEADRTLAMVLREAVTNVIRHSKATRCRIDYERRGDAVVLTVEDDGIGTLGTEGNGVRSMRERVEALAGRFSVTAGDGVRVEAVIPKGEPT